MRTMYDSVTAARLPVDAKMVACYIDGRYANEAAVRARCPHALVVRITPHGVAGADVADCETGDLTPAQAAGWAANEVAAGRQPTIYCNESTWPDVRAAVAGRGLAGKVSYWIAHYDNVQQIPAGAVAKQYIERTDQNLDYSVVADYWPGVDPAPVVHEQTAVTPAPIADPEDSLPVIVSHSSGAHFLTDLGTWKKPIHNQDQEKAYITAGVRHVPLPDPMIDALAVVA